MEDNVLKVKLVADASDYKKDMKDAGEATEKFGDESKKSSTALEKLQKTINEQKTRLKALKDEYTDLILAQDKSDKSTKDLESKMKLLNAQLLINEKRLQAINAATNATKNTPIGANFNRSTQAAAELQDTMESLRSMSFIGFVAGIGKIGAEFREARKEFKDFQTEAKKFLDKDSDIYKGPNAYLEWEGPDVAQENYNAHMKEANSLLKQNKTAGASMFKALNAGALKAVVAIGAVVAVVASLVAAIKNALKVANQLRTQFFDAQKIGMSNASYEEWAYVMGQVGIEADKLSDFLKTLADEQNNVRDGSEDTIKAFKELGLSVEEVSTMSQEKLFTETVKRLQQVENEVARTSLAYRIFGEEDAAQLMNVLRLTNDEIERMTNNFYLLGGSTSDSAIEKSVQLSNAVANMKLAWQGLTKTLAEAFMPVITAVVNWITVAIAKVNMFIRAMLGYDIVAEGSKSTESATKNVGSYSAALDKATQAAEKLKRTTQGFDELNIVADPAARSSANSAVGNTGSYGGGFEVPDLNMGLGQDLGLEKFAESMERLKDIIRNVMPWALVGVGILLCFLGGPAGWIAGLSLMGLGIAVGIESGAWAEQFTAVWEGIKGVWRNIKQWFIDNVIPVFTKEYWKQKWANIKESVAMSPIGQAISNGWNGIKQWFAENVKPIFTKEYWATKWANIKNAVAMSAIGQAISKGWADMKKWFAENVKPIFTVAYWKQKWENIRTATAQKMEELGAKLDEKWNALKKWFAEKVAPVFTKAYWKQKWENIRSATSQKMDEIKGKLDEKWNALKKWFAEKVAPIFTLAYWQNKWNTVKTSAATKLDEIRTTISTKWNLFKSFWNVNVKKIFTKDFWIQKWNAAKQGAIDGVKAFINGIITKIETGINSIVRKLNGIGKINIPEWLGGGSFGGFNLKTIYIPRLAAGGITNGSTLANVGERGREAILPLENNTGWMDALADRLASRMAGGNTKVVLKVGERELGYAVIDAINKNTKQTGGLKLQLV